MHACSYTPIQTRECFLPRYINPQLQRAGSGSCTKIANKMLPYSSPLLPQPYLSHSPLSINCARRCQWASKTCWVLSLDFKGLDALCFMCRAHVKMQSWVFTGAKLSHIKHCRDWRRMTILSNVHQHFSVIERITESSTK